MDGQVTMQSSVLTLDIDAAIIEWYGMRHLLVRYSYFLNEMYINGSLKSSKQIIATSSY